MQGAVISEGVMDAQILLVRPTVNRLAGHGGILLALLNANRE